MVVNGEWEMIVQLHQHIKTLIILAEEYEVEEWKKFLQPTLEEVSGFDHICRAKAAELDLIPDFDADSTVRKEYIKGNFKKALGHLYRAFFDTADWISVIMREKVLRATEPYSNECITAILPDYYDRIRPSVDQINQEIATIRDSKDIVSNDTMMLQVEKYKEKIMELIEFHQVIISKVISFEEYMTKQKKASVKDNILAVGLVVLGVVLAAIWGFLKNIGVSQAPK